jgi:hypothetical protein
MSGAKPKVKLYFEPPDENTPGYLRRQREARQFVEILDSDYDPGAIDRIVEFLVPYIQGEGVTAENAADFLLDATSDQFYAMLIALMGVSEKKAE